MSGPPLIGSGASGTAIVHLGVGAFARAHVLWGTALAADHQPGPWAVCAVGQHSRAVVSALRANQWAYDVELLDGDHSTTTRVEIVADGLVADDEPAALAARLASPETTVVTITATEAGYPVDPHTRRLDLSAPGVNDDLGGALAPKTVVGQIVAMAAARVRTGAGAVNVIVCDNVLSGGDLLRGLAIEFAMRSGQDDAASWLQDCAAFPNAVVDRVAPAVPAERQPSVRAEPFFRWVIQDSFTAPRPAWEAAGTVLVDDVAPWQSAKLHLVNAPHSMLAYLGLACGYTTVHEAVHSDLLHDALQDALAAEFIPAVPTAEGLSPVDDAQTALRRFANSALPHQLAQIGSGGSVKLSQRLSAPIVSCAAADRAPTWSTAVIAGWAHAVLRGDVDDPNAAQVRSVFEGPSHDRARALLTICGLGHDSPRGEPVVDALSGWLDVFDRNATLEAIRSALKEK